MRAVVWLNNITMRMKKREMAFPQRGGRKMLSKLVCVQFCLTLRFSVLSMCVSPVVSQSSTGKLVTSRYLHELALFL